MYVAAVLASVPLEQFLVLTWTIFNIQFYDDILLEGRKEERDHKPGSDYKSLSEDKHKRKVRTSRFTILSLALPPVPDAFHLNTIYSYPLHMQMSIRDI